MNPADQLEVAADSTEAQPDPGDDGPSQAVRAGLAVGAMVLFTVLVGWKWLVVILGIVLLVTVHEMGHYLMARRGGMAVTEFFIGFGPRIFSFRRNGTEYGFKAIPAGAYVKVPGMYAIDEVPPEVEPFTYRQAPFRARLGMVLGGPFANLGLAVILLFGLHVFVGTASDNDWHIGSVVERTAAAEAGIEPGDRIVSIDGQPASTFDDLVDLVGPRGGQPVAVVVDRPAGDGAASQVTVDAVLGDRVGEVDDGSAADQLGLRENDVIREIDGVAAVSVAELGAVSTQRPGEEIDIVVDRFTEPCQLRVTLGPDLSDQSTTGFLGVSPDYPRTTSSVPGGAISAVDDFAQITKGATVSLAQFFSPSRLSGFFERVATTPPAEQVTTEDDPCPAPVGGPIDSEDEGRILSIYGAVRLGTSFTDIGGLVSFFALMNIFLGVFNLIPLLPLDGGHATIAIYEKIRSRGGTRYQVDVAKALPVAYMVVAVLVMVGLGALYLDIVDPVQ